MDWLRNAGIGLLDLSFVPNPRLLLQVPFLLPFTTNDHRTIKEPSGPVCEHPQLSCPAQMPPKFDECCLNAPSGHFLSTQFWDTSPPLGANDTWTLHGLWPDYCTGGFEQYCDDSRSKSQGEIELLLEEASKSTHPQLLDFMNKHWLSYDSRDSHLWTHEWNKHGTCISTLKPKCYAGDDGISSSSSSSSPRDILDYFTHATTLYSTLDTHETLAANGIIPSQDQMYKLLDLQKAFSSSKHAHIPTLKCNPRHELQEVWYHFLVRGPLRDADPSLSTSNSSGIFIPTAADGQISNCPQEGIKYLPKQKRSGPSPPGDGNPYPTPNPDPSPFRGQGHLKVRVLSDGGNDYRPNPSTDEFDKAETNAPYFTGCLIRSGAWYTSGTCATYSTKEDVKQRLAEENQDDNKKANLILKTFDHNGILQEQDDDDEKEHLFTLQSTLAPCSILDSSTPSKYGQAGEFTCARRLPIQSIFGVGNSTDTDNNNNNNIILVSKSVNDNEDGSGPLQVLSYQGSSVFFADKVPGQFEKVAVFADDGNGSRQVKLQVHWEGI